MNQCITESGATRLRGNSLKKKLTSQQFVVGTFLEIPSPVLVELLGLAGFDFVIIDREHGPIDWGQTENLIRAGVSTGISTIVRPPNSEATAVAQPLDWGGRQEFRCRTWPPPRWLARSCIPANITR